MQTKKMLFVAVVMLTSAALTRSTHASDPQAPSQREDIANSSGTSVDTEGFNLSLTTDESEYASGTPIDIQMALKDVSYPRWTTADADHSTYFLDIRGSDGKSVSLTASGKKYFRNSGMYADEGLMVFVLGMEERVPLFRAGSFFNMSRPDVYTIQASRLVPSLEDPKKMVPIYSNVATIRIEEPKTEKEQAEVVAEKTKGEEQPAK